MPATGARAGTDRGSGISTGVNFTLAACHTAVNLYQFVILPVWLLPLDFRWAWTLLPLAFLNNPYWSLIHEAIHDLFHPVRRGERYLLCPQPVAAARQQPSFYLISIFTVFTTALR